MAKNIKFKWEFFTLDGTFTAITLLSRFVANSTLILLNGIPLKTGTEYTEGADFLTITSSLFDDVDKVGWEVAVHYAIAETVSGTVSDVSDFKSQMAIDTVNCFLNESEFAETIFYTPFGGTAKSINAIVVRNRLEPNSQEQNRSLVNQVIIDIANDVTYGVISINKGQDKVSLPAIIGGANSDWLIVDIINHDDGMWRLLARK